MLKAIYLLCSSTSSETPDMLSAQLQVEDVRNVVSYTSVFSLLLIFNLWVYSVCVASTFHSECATPVSHRF